jgi:hypothetical protein
VSGPDGWIIPATAEDHIRRSDKRLTRLERLPRPMSPGDLLGPGMASQAVQIMDWNAVDATYNGFFYTNPGGFHSPDNTKSWTGQVIAKDNGTGMQHVWNTDGPYPLYWLRTYKPNPNPGGNPIFDSWKRFASEDGLIPWDLIHGVKWEEEEITITSGHIATGSVTMRLAHIPMPESFLAWWHPEGEA